MSVCVRARARACLQKLADSTGRARELCDHVLQITELLMQVLDGEESVAEVSPLASLCLFLFRLLFIKTGSLDISIHPSLCIDM